MYITYDRKHFSVDCTNRDNYRRSVTGGDYRPTWLIRVSDWKKVPGEEAVEGYHTLSYCWEQSGDVVQRNDGSGEFDCIDKGRHCIIDHVEERKASNYFRTTVNKYVQYEELLQQVCNDFQVDYLWYDKVCIDQSDKEIKLSEIKQMHKIYRNARYTIVMIPELYFRDPEHFEPKKLQDGDYARLAAEDVIDASKWMTRSWTLEEVMMSKHILIIGINANMFQYSLHSVDIPTTVDALSEMLLDFGKENGGKGSVSQALSEAHLRTSTKPHDMIFALINTFSHVLEGMDISYDTDIQTAFNIFYQGIATKDLSILYFGIDHELFRPYVRNSTMGNYKLPSWTGVAGYHPSRYANSTISSSLSYYINDDNMYMYVKTKCYWDISITQYKDIYSLYEKSFVQKLKACIKNYKSKGKWTSVIVTEKSIYLNSWADDINFNSKIYMTHYHQRSNDPLTRIRPLSLTEDCKECIVLPILLKVHIPFEAYGKPTRYIKDYKHAYFLPVIRKSLHSEARYKAIGVYYIGEEIEPTTLLMKCWNHSVGRDDINSIKKPQEMLDALFENYYHDTPKEFIIE